MLKCLLLLTSIGGGSVWDKPLYKEGIQLKTLSGHNCLRQTESIFTGQPHYANRPQNFTTHNLNYLFIYLFIYEVRQTGSSSVRLRVICEWHCVGKQSWGETCWRHTVANNLTFTEHPMLLTNGRNKFMSQLSYYGGMHWRMHGQLRIRRTQLRNGCKSNIEVLKTFKQIKIFKIKDISQNQLVEKKKLQWIDRCLKLITC